MSTVSFNDFFDNTLVRNGEGYRLNVTPAQVAVTFCNRTWDKIIHELFRDTKHQDWTHIGTVNRHFQKMEGASASRMRKYLKGQDGPEETKAALLKNAPLIQSLYAQAVEHRFRSMNPSDAKYFDEYLRPVFRQSADLPFYQQYAIQDRAIITWEDLDYLGLKKEEATDQRNGDFDSCAWALMHLRPIGLAAKIKEHYLVSKSLPIDLQNFDLKQDPLPDDLVVYRKRGQIVHMGVLTQDGMVLSKEKEGITKRLIWQIYAHDETEVLFYRGKPEAFISDEKSIAERLQKGLNIPDALISKLEQIASGALKISSDGFILISHGYMSHVMTFSHRDFPHLEIQMSHNTRVVGMTANMEKQFQNNALAERICKVCELTQLIIPRIKKFGFAGKESKYVFLVQEKLPYIPQPEAQDALYEKYASAMAVTARQLARFVAETGFYEVVPVKVPILNEQPGYQGAPRIGLIDLGEISPDNPYSSDRKQGFYGGTRSLGVVGLLFIEAQIDEVIAMAKKYGIPDHSVYNKKHRMEEIKAKERILRFRNWDLI